MSLLVKTAKGQIENIIKDAAKAAFNRDDLPAFVIETPVSREHGDFAVNAAMIWARELHAAPRGIAEKLFESAYLEGTYIDKCEIAGPGFINFFLSDKFYSDIVLDVLNKGDSFGRSDYGEGKRVLVEFVSANPTGPMHIGNARGGALGDCLASVLSAAGYYTEREFYINDAGNQINKFALSLDLRYLELFKSGIEMPEDSYHGDDIIAHAKAFAARYGDSFVQKSERERRQALVDFALPENIKGLKRDLESYRIHYDTWFKESTLHESGATREITEKLKQSGHTYTLDGALWFKATDFGCDKDFVLVRANGVPTYIVPDIAYHYNKLCVRKFDRAIDVLGADHHGYVPRLKAALSAIGAPADNLDVVIMQMVRLVRGGEVIKASKRSGKAITLVTLLEEVPIDAARFFFNLREPNSHFDFDLDLAISETNNNPVFYVQYAHARICSILRNLESEGISTDDVEAENLSLLNAAEERELILYIASLTDEIICAAKTYDPARITHYATELATRFHKFYAACRVNSGDSELTLARLALTKATGIVIKNVLNLLSITAPEKM
ncbi:MAG: arginine--tRNA ligase [Clostridia bacterium]|nr:arginine--tRNA ligase [Clostridia bacterium]